jgi:hypothetical protein
MLSTGFPKDKWTEQEVLNLPEGEHHQFEWMMPLFV